MRRFFMLTVAAALTTSLATNAWSQGGQGGGGGGTGGAGGAGGAGAAGTAGTAGTAGGARPTGPVTTPGAAGTTGTAGTPGATGAVGVGGNTNAGVAAGAAATQSNIGANPQSGRAGFNVTNNGVTNNGINKTPFFSDPGVRQQLKMNDTQFNNLNRAYQQAYGQYNRGMGSMGNNLNAQQREQLAQQYANRFNTDFGRTVDSTFTDPNVRARYDQLNRQYMGFNSFNDQGIQRQLNLTPQQLNQVRQLASQWRQQLTRMRGNGTNANANNINQQQWNQMYTQYWDQLNGLLTPQQRQTWTQLTGQRYTFSPNLYFPDGNATSTTVNGGTAAGVPPIKPYGAATPGAQGSGVQGTAQGQTGTAPQPQGSSANAGAQGGTVR